MPVQDYYYVEEEEEEDYSMAKNDFVYMAGETFESLLVAAYCVKYVITSPIMSIKYLINLSIDLAEIIEMFVSSIWGAIRCYLRIVGLTLKTTINVLIYPAYPNYEMLDIMKVHEELKIITDRLRITPFSHKDGIALHIFLKKIPKFIWDNILPFPEVFFRDSIIRIEPVEGKELATYIKDAHTMTSRKGTSGSILRSTPHFENLR